MFGGTAIECHEHVIVPVSPLQQVSECVCVWGGGGCLHCHQCLSFYHFYWPGQYAFSGGGELWGGGDWRAWV